MKDIGKEGLGKHMASGHIMRYVDGKYQYEHILNMEKKLGRKLRPNEVVHHKDGNPANNAISNLLLTTKAGHNKIDKTHHRGGRYAGDAAGDK